MALPSKARPFTCAPLPTAGGCWLRARPAWAGAWCPSWRCSSYSSWCSCSLQWTQPQVPCCCLRPGLTACSARLDASHISVRCALVWEMQTYIR